MLFTNKFPLFQKRYEVFFHFSKNHAGIPRARSKFRMGSWPFSVHCGIPILLVHYHEESDIKNAPHVCERRFSAVRKGLEPSTSGVTGRHSNQLNYRTLRIFALTVSGCFPNADAKIGIFPLLANFFT